MSLLLPLLRYVPPLYIHVYNYQLIFINSYQRLDFTEKEFTVGADTFAAKYCTLFIIDKKSTSKILISLALKTLALFKYTLPI